jgi:hypothetical protein
MVDLHFVVSLTFFATSRIETSRVLPLHVSACHFLAAIFLASFESISLFAC